MGFRDLLLFYLVTGFTVRWIGTAASAGPSAVVIWLIACLAFYIPLMFTVLELSSRYPNEGGCYVWSKRAFGDFAGFITGWTYWTCNLPYFPGLFYFTAAAALFIGGAEWQQLGESPLYFITFLSSRSRWPRGSMCVGWGWVSGFTTWEPSGFGCRASFSWDWDSAPGSALALRRHSRRTRWCLAPG